MINGFFYAPVIEPEHPDAFITENMYESFLKGDFNKVPTFVGLNSNELYYMYLSKFCFGIIYTLLTYITNCRSNIQRKSRGL